MNNEKKFSLYTLRVLVLVTFLSSIFKPDMWDTYVTIFTGWLLAEGLFSDD